MKRLILPGIPFALSLALSLSTAGSHVHWQDSGFFLVAVKELGVLYPPGFALYVLLCRAWTLALGFIDFAYAVHLFSALCSAGAAATLAVAARDLLRSRGPLFRTVEEDGPRAAQVGVAIGCLAACGYTFWAAAILAKVYAFYYLVLTLLIWRMIRADESGRPRDFTFVAALIGLAWQVHPSATTAGPALLLFVLFHRKALGAKGLAWRTGLAAACALGPVLLLPALAAREPALMFGDPRIGSTFWSYLTGSRFTSIPGVFGLAESRVLSVGQYLWEELLGVGVVAVAFGLLQAARTNRRLLAGVAAWVVPVIVFTVLFKLEGQHDFWFVSAWLVLWLVAGLGLHSGLRAAGSRGSGLLAAAIAVGVVWPVALNHPLLDRRNDTLPEAMGHFLLDALDENAVLVLHSDDAIAASLFLQRVRGVRPDVALIQSSFLGEGTGWYEGILRRRYPFLKPPDTGSVVSRNPRLGRLEVELGAFANANASKSRPLFFERPPPPDLLRPDYTLIPAGPLLKLVPRGEGRIDSKYWKVPIEPEQVPPLFRRERGHSVELTPEGVEVRAEAYEHRLLRDLLRARKNLADWAALSGTAEGYRRSAELYESILALDPWMREDPGAVVPLARAYAALRRFDLAEPWLKKSLQLRLPPGIRAQLCCLLVEICTEGKRPKEAAGWAAAALAIPELPSDLRKKLEGR